MKTKTREIKIRCTEVLFRKLLAICAVTGKTKTAVLEDLIYAEYDSDSRYSKQYLADLNREKG